MSRLRRIWALMAAVAAVLGVSLSAALGGSLGTTAATGATPALGATTVTNTSSPGLSASTIFGCRASVVRAELAGKSIAEPAVANPGPNTAGEPPCHSDSTLVQKVNLLGNSPLNIGTVGPAGAYTFETGALGASTSPGVTAVADVSGLTLSPGSGYTLTVAGPLQAQAGVTCVGTTLAPFASAGLVVLKVTGPGLPAGGQIVDLGPGVNQLGGALKPLSALLTLQADEKIVTANAVTERLLDITLLGSGVHLVIGEATATYPNADVCSGNVPGGSSTTTTPGGTTTVTFSGTATTVTNPGTVVIEPSGQVPGPLEVCAPGSVLDPKSGNCVIYYGGQTIFVSKPFKGPVGVVVVPLGAARRKYHSPCLYGPGPKYADLVLKAGAHALGTFKSDRMLGLNVRQSINGLAGNDCIDERSANGTLRDGNGKDRLYVTRGHNRIIAGNGDNIIHGRNGRNWITDGTGTDHIYGGSQPNRIDAFSNKKYVYGGSSHDRLWSNSQVAQFHCRAGSHDIVFLRRGPAAYAKRHGCPRVRLLH
ncbi:MAG TPA: calcium-binding protein [Solirubrobacteraceae bacterium]|nr:calcium-binding protein [Solirubrobacteraceae bacterium]